MFPRALPAMESNGDAHSRFSYGCVLNRERHYRLICVWGYCFYSFFFSFFFFLSDSPEIQPKFVKGSKRYGRRSTPEFIEPISDFSEVTNANLGEGEDLEDNYDSAVPRKREVRPMFLMSFSCLYLPRLADAVLIVDCPCMYCISGHPQTSREALFLANQLSGMQSRS